MVGWGLYPPTLEGLRSFLNQPRWLIIWVWNAESDRQAKQVNNYSTSTAKLALLVEMGFAGFGGQKVDPSFDRYLPYQIVDANDPKVKRLRELVSKVSPRAVRTFDRLKSSGKLPPLVERSFNQNAELLKVIEAIRDREIV